jgi:ribosomal protein S17E
MICRFKMNKSWVKMMAKIQSKIKVTELKKQLRDLKQDDLIKLVVESYKLSDDVKEFFSVKFIGETAVEELFEKYSNQIENEFFPDKGFGQLRLSEAKKAISAFKKLTGNEKLTYELMLFYVETGVEFTNTYGDISENFYISMESMYEKVIEKCNESKGFYEAYKDRIAAIVSETGGIGWGFHDSLSELYWTVNWLE